MELVITDINLFRRFYLDLVQVGTGKKFDDVYISKRCYDYSDCIKIGDTITTTLTHYKFSKDGEVENSLETNEIYELACNCK